MQAITFRRYKAKHSQPAAYRRIMSAATRRGGIIMARFLLPAFVVFVALLGAQPAQAHTTGEIRAAAQSWMDQGAPYGRLTPASRAVVSAGTWAAWSHCGLDPQAFTASVRGYGNDLAVIRFTGPGSHTEWTAHYRSGRWTFQLPAKDVTYLRTHTAQQVASCA